MKAASKQRLVVCGMWHLGLVTSACCADILRRSIPDIKVTGYDWKGATIKGINSGAMPIFEPGLTECIKETMAEGALTFSSDTEVLRDATMVWFTQDTPVLPNGKPAPTQVIKNIERVLKHLQPGTHVLISSQLQVGTTATLEKRFQQFTFAYSPENLQLGQAMQSFTHANRIILGVRSPDRASLFAYILEKICKNVLVMSTESAEMSKHALNTFLAMSVAYANELGRISAQVGASADDVTRALKSDPRIGPGAYLSAGGPFEGQTLGRDVNVLAGIGRHNKALRLSVIPAINKSNKAHAELLMSKVIDMSKNLKLRKLLVVGLTYKKDTSTLRGSEGVRLVQALQSQGMVVDAFDPTADREEAKAIGVHLVDAEIVHKETYGMIVVMRKVAGFSANKLSCLPEIHHYNR